MQHLDDAHRQAEAWMAAWLTSKPRTCRALIVKDLLARLRVILWCSDRSWESSRRYMEKLARIDYGESQDGTPHPFVVLLQRIREDLSPGWILIDARAGLGDVSGFLTGGLCHFHVLLEAAKKIWHIMLVRHLADRLDGRQRDALRPMLQPPAVDHSSD